MKTNLMILIFAVLYSIGYAQQTNNTIYEIFVRSFYDSNNDGIGDLNGITQKLDYLNDGNSKTDTDLEVGILWLMPVFPSQTYHGYDVTDYKSINPEYGTLKDFEKLLKEAHKRGIRVVLDIPLNHSSNKNPWFISAIKDPKSPYRDYYYIDQSACNTHIHHIGKTWYFGLFGPTMPDFNYDNPKVREAIMDIADFWLDKGVDGFRLDAAKHIYGCDYTFVWEDKNKTNEWWNEFRKHVNDNYKNKVIFGEVLDSPDHIKDFAWGLDGLIDEPFMHELRNFCNGQRPNNLAQWWSDYLDKCRTNNPNFNLYPYISSHDENPRFASYLGEDKPLLEKKYRSGLSTLLLISKYPILYYGDELRQEGWKWNGDDGSQIWDETLREPFPWYAADNSKKPGQPTWIEEAWKKIEEAGSTVQKYNEREGISVEEQSKEKTSMLHFVSSLTNFRAEHPDFSNEDIIAVPTDNDWIVFEKGKYLVMINGHLEDLEFNLNDNLSAYRHAKIVYKEGEDVNTEVQNSKIAVPSYGVVILQKDQILGKLSK